MVAAQHICIVFFVVLIKKPGHDGRVVKATDLNPVLAAARYLLSSDAQVQILFVTLVLLQFFVVPVVRDAYFMGSFILL